MQTLKKNIVRAMAIAPTMDVFAGNKVILVTAAGVISGVINQENPDQCENLGRAGLLTVLDNVVDSYGEENIDGNDGFVILSDVTMLTGTNNRVNLDTLIVFYDQIIAATIGRGI